LRQLSNPEQCRVIHEILAGWVRRPEFKSIKVPVVAQFELRHYQSSGSGLRKFQLWRFAALSFHKNAKLLVSLHRDA